MRRPHGALGVSCATLPGRLSPDERVAVVEPLVDLGAGGHPVGSRVRGNGVVVRLVQEVGLRWRREAGGNDGGEGGIKVR